MYSTYNEKKSLVAVRFIRTLKNKISKYRSSTSKNAYFNKLDDIVNEYNDTYHETIKMRLIDVKENTYINIDKEVNDRKPKFKVGDHAPNYSEEIKNTDPWTYVVSYLIGEQITGTFYGRELQKTNQE